MAQLVTLKLVIDDTNEENVYDGLNEMFRASQLPVDPMIDSKPWIVDWSISDVSETAPVLDKLIASGRYEEDKAFCDYVVFSPSEARASDDMAGFWSNSFGWTTLDLATKFDCLNRDMPIGLDNDAAMILAPYGLNFFRLLVIEEGGSVAALFECWAGSKEEADEQALLAFPSGQVSLFADAFAVEPGQKEKRIGVIKVALTSDTHELEKPVFTLEVSLMDGSDCIEKDAYSSGLPNDAPEAEVAAYLEAATKEAFVRHLKEGKVQRFAGQESIAGHAGIAGIVAVKNLREATQSETGTLAL